MSKNIFILTMLMVSSVSYAPTEPDALVAEVLEEISVMARSYDSRGISAVLAQHKDRVTSQELKIIGDRVLEEYDLSQDSYDKLSPVIDSLNVYGDISILPSVDIAIDILEKNALELRNFDAVRAVLTKYAGGHLDRMKLYNIVMRLISEYDYSEDMFYELSPVIADFQEYLGDTSTIKIIPPLSNAISTLERLVTQKNKLGVGKLLRKYNSGDVGIIPKSDLNRVNKKIAKMYEEAVGLGRESAEVEYAKLAPIQEQLVNYGANRSYDLLPPFIIFYKI